MRGEGVRGVAGVTADPQTIVVRFVLDSTKSEFGDHQEQMMDGKKSNILACILLCCKNANIKDIT